VNLSLKQALEFGAKYSAERLSLKEDFLEIWLKILFPDEAKKVENTLLSIGLNSLCDNVIICLNRAAEDAENIYFKRTASELLADKFRPIINHSLNKVGATCYWTDVTTTYNRGPIVKTN
jgi:hypothetical protein